MIGILWRLANQDFNICLVDAKNQKYNGLLAGVSFPPSSLVPALAFLSRLKLSFPSTLATRASEEENNRQT